MAGIDCYAQYIFTLDPEEQIQVLDGYLSHLGKRIKAVEKNGLCILSAVQEALHANKIVHTIQELKDILQTEINRDIGLCKTFSDKNVDLMSDLEQFFKDDK